LVRKLKWKEKYWNDGGMEEWRNGGMRKMTSLGKDVISNF
jgi:hypothetical protein